MKIALLALFVAPIFAAESSGSDEDDSGSSCRTIFPGAGTCWSTQEAIMRSEMDILATNPSLLDTCRTYVICKDVIFYNDIMPMTTFNPNLHIQCQDNKHERDDLNSCKFEGGDVMLTNAKTTADVIALKDMLYPGGSPYEDFFTNYTGPPDSSHLKVDSITFEGAVVNTSAAVELSAPGLGTDLNFTHCFWSKIDGARSGIRIRGSDAEMTSVNLHKCEFINSKYAYHIIETGCVADGTCSDSFPVGLRIDEGTNIDSNEAGESLITTEYTTTTMKKTSFEENKVKEGYSLVTNFEPAQFNNDGETVSGINNEIEKHLLAAGEENELCLEVGLYEKQGDNIVILDCMDFETKTGDSSSGLSSNAKGGIILGTLLVTFFVSLWVYLTYFHKKKDAVGDGKDPDDDDDNDEP